jgi:acetyltransferase-like isoleucine patch superfamily enzyme
VRRSFGQLARKAIANPGAALTYAIARLRGEWSRWYLPAVGYRFSAGPGLLMHGRLKLRGPGRVIVGKHVQIWETVTPWTTTREAAITVGDGTVLAGTRMSCASSIAIGAHCIVADCRIMDSDFHPLSENRRDPAAPVRTLPVVVEDNVWLAAQTAVLPGVTIGRNSVVSFGAVCGGKYPPDVIIVGNPGRVAGKIPPAQPATPAAETDRAAVRP